MNLGSFVLNESEVYKHCSDNQFIHPENVPQGLASTTVMAIDWAYNNLDGSGSHTVVTIATKYSEKIKIIYAKRFDGPRIMIL